MELIVKEDFSEQFSFRYKRQKKQFSACVERLGIKLYGEAFILYTLLSRDWNREIIVYEISKIKKEHQLIRIECRTSGSSYSFSASDVSNCNSSDIQESKRNISYDLRMKIYR